MGSVKRICSFMLILCMSVLVSEVAFAGTPHLVFGTVVNSDGSTPAASDIEITAYISTRTDEVLSTPTTANYDGATWGLDTGNFATSWSAENGDVLVVSLLNTTNFEGGQVQVTLTNAGADDAGAVTLAALTPTALTITPSSAAVQSGSTQQFTAVATFDGISGTPDVSSSATWTSSDTDKGTITATGLLTAVHTGTTDVTATFGSLTSAASTVTVSAGAADASSSAVSASTDPVTVSADGSNSATVTVSLYDANLNPVTSETVTITLSGSGNSIDGTAYSAPVALATTTNASGQVTFQLSSTTAQDVTVTAAAGGTTITDTAVVTFAAGSFSASSSTVVAAPSSVTTDGGATATITVTLIDALGNVVPSQTVTLEASGSSNTIVQPASVTDGSGQTSGTIASTLAESKTVTAKVGADTVGTCTVTFVPGAASQIALAAGKTTLASDSKGNTTMTATVLDANGNTVVGDSSTVVTFAIADGSGADGVKLAFADGATNPATVTNGVATIGIVSVAGTVTTPPNVDTVTATSAPVLTPVPVAGIDINIVNFSIEVSAPAAPFYAASTGIHLVTSASTPTTATLAGVGSVTGDYSWALTGDGAISSTTADSITFTSPESITGDSTTATITLTSVSDSALSDTITVTVYNPLAVTAPTTAIGVAVGGTSTVTASGGTGTYGFESSNTAAATIDAATGVITPVTAGTLTVNVKDTTYGDFATANGFRATTAQIEIVAPIAISGVTVVDAATSTTFTATGGTGTVVWSASAGTIDSSTGEYTAPAVASGNQAVTITATDATYSDVLTTQAVSVYAAANIDLAADYVDGTPSTYPMLKFTTNTTLTAADDTRNYTWAVTAWDGASAGSITGTTFTLVPDVLFGVSGAGVYTVTLTDSDNSALAAGTLRVRVPMKIAATVGDVAGIYKTDTDTGDTFTVTGGPSVNDYLFTALDVNGNAAAADTVGTFTTSTATSNSDVFTFATISELTGFQVQVSLDSSSTDTNTVRLIADGLGSVSTPVYWVMPVVTVTGTVVDANGDPLVGVTVTPTFDATLASQTTDFNGDFTFATALDDVGVAYKFQLHLVNYIDKVVTSTEIAAGDVTLESLGAGGTITGVITAGATPTTGITVKVKADGSYITDSAGAAITVYADPAGAYSFPVPEAFANAATYTVEARKTGYIFGDYDSGTDQGILTGVAVGDTTANLTLNPVTIITVTPVVTFSDDGDDTNDNVQVKITADAGGTAFAGTVTEISVTDSADAAVTLDAFASAGANTWSFTHDAYENFTITIKADAGDDNDVDSGYVATKTWSYVKSVTVPVVTAIANPVIAGGTATSGTTGITLPPGGLTGEVIDTVTVVIGQADASSAGATLITGSEIVEVDLIDASGAELDNSTIGRIEITMAFDPTVVTVGSLESGSYVIYHAADMSALVAGTAIAVPVSQIVGDVDYTNGLVTFWVDHLSAFGLGLPASIASAAVDNGGSSSCFIATAAYGSPMEKHVMVLRKFRDRYLLPNSIGKAFVQAYYHYSPPFANFIAQHDVLRGIVRVALLPLVGMGYVALYLSPLQIMLLGMVMVVFGIALATMRARRKEHLDPAG